MRRVKVNLTSALLRIRNNTKPKPRIQTDLHSSYQSKVSETQERTRPAYLAPTQTFKARPHTRYTHLKLYMFQSKILDLSNCNACQVQSVSDKFKTVCIKSKTCPMLRIEISFKVLVHDRFRSNFISSAQVRKPKSNQETYHPQFSIHNSNNKTIHHFSMRPKHHEQSKQLDSHCRKQFLPNPHQSNQHVSECSDTVQSPWPIDQPSTCWYW